MNESRNAGILRLKRIREFAEAKNESAEPLRQRFERLKTGPAPAVVSARGLFQTPPAVAAQLVSSLERPFGRVLEPSAGLGRLFSAIRAIDPACPVALVDVSPECCRELYRASEGDGAVSLFNGDFLAMMPARLGVFDTIVMNPPFCRGLDIVHVRHAEKFLKPGGQLAAIVASGPRQKAAFGECHWIDLPRGSFRSEGTDVGAAIIRIATAE